MSPASVAGIVYHGADEHSADSIRNIGLDRVLWALAGGGYGVDSKGLSVTTVRSIAEFWARDRASVRGGAADGVVLEANAADLPLRGGTPGNWTDPFEFYVPVEDFDLVGPGIFR